MEHVAKKRHTNIDLTDPIFSQNLFYPAGQLQAHLLSAAVDGNPIHVCVGPCEVEILKQVGGIRLGRNNL